MRLAGTVRATGHIDLTAYSKRLTECTLGATKQFGCFGLALFKRENGKRNAGHDFGSVVVSCSKYYQWCYMSQHHWFLFKITGSNRFGAMTKKPLPPERKIENDKLKAIYEAKKKELGLTHHALADALDISQSGVSHYLNGTNPLNTSVAAVFAGLLRVDVSEFSPRLAADIAKLAQAIDHSEDQQSNIAARVELLSMVASDRSRSILERIAKAAADGHLSEDDLSLLDQVATRIAAKNTPRPAGPNKRIAEKIKDANKAPE